MRTDNKFTVEKLTWKELRTAVKKANVKLAKIIDDFGPDDEYILYRVKYPFGATIFDEGLLYLPNQSGEFVPLTDNSIPVELKKQLSYKAIPLGLVLNKTTEVYIEIDNKIIPLTVFSTGKLFGTWEILDPPCSYFTKLAWNMVSGSRSLFSLPKLSETGGLRRLQNEFGIRGYKPKCFKDHYLLFRDIINSDNFPTPWFSEVIYFSAKWYEQLDKNDALLMLQKYLYQYVWQQSMFWRSEVTQNLIWQKFILKLRNLNIDCDNYYLESLKHIIAIGVGALPSFQAANFRSQNIAPIEELQKILMECYRLAYIPTLMCPHHLSLKESGSCGYYSANESSLIERVPRSREIQNIMKVARNIRELFSYFKDYALNDGLKLENTSIFTFFEKAQVDFFHTNFDSLGKLRLSSNLPKEDPTLTLFSEGYGIREFCFASTFFRGCIRVLVK